MTTEPKFVPSNGAKIVIDDFTANVRLVDCVGYVIPGAKGMKMKRVLVWLEHLGMMKKFLL